MIEINLVPDVKLELLKARRQQKMVISGSILVAIVSVGVVVLMAVYAFGVQALAEGIADNGITENTKELKDVKDLSKTLTIQNQLDQLTAVQSDKNMTSRLFDIVGTIVPAGENQIKITRLSLDSEENTVNIEAEATNGYEAMEVFKKTLAQTTFQYSKDDKGQKPLKIATGISEGDRRYGENADGQRVLRFDLTFTYPDELFSPDSLDGKIIAPTQQRATDSTQGVPASLFTDGGSQ